MSISLYTGSTIGAHLTSLAKERAVVEHLARDLAQAMDESYVDIEHTLAEVEVR